MDEDIVYSGVRARGKCHINIIERRRWDIGSYRKEIWKTACAGEV